MTKKSIAIGIIIGIPALALAGLFGYVFYASPHMKVQPHLRAFQSLAPLPPEGTVPVEVPEHLPRAARAPLLKNPLPVDKQNLLRGQVYYHYYCVFCHGEKGEGNGPVGQSYVPKPADLRTARVKHLHDGELLRAMLTGIGHEPVLERVVPPQHRWYLALYVRAFQVSRRSF